eukprot:9223341-Lingulodinium_polyedra.AAC.1
MVAFCELQPVGDHPSVCENGDCWACARLIVVAAFGQFVASGASPGASLRLARLAGRPVRGLVV